METATTPIASQNRFWLGVSLCVTGAASAIWFLSIFSRQSRRIEEGSPLCPFRSQIMCYSRGYSKTWISRLPGYIASIACNSMIVLAAFTTSTSSMRVLPVSRAADPSRASSIRSCRDSPGSQAGSSLQQNPPRTRWQGGFSPFLGVRRIRGNYTSNMPIQGNRPLRARRVVGFLQIPSVRCLCGPCGRRVGSAKRFTMPSGTQLPLRNVEVCGAEPGILAAPAIPAGLADHRKPTGHPNLEFHDFMLQVAVASIALHVRASHATAPAYRTPPSRTDRHNRLGSVTTVWQNFQ